MTPEEFAALRRELSEETIAALVLLYAELGSWYDTDRDVFLEQALPLLRGAQTTLASYVAAYVAWRAEEATGQVVPPPVLPDMFNLRRGVDDTEVYQRPFTTIYAALGEGKPLDEAVHLGEVRLAEIVEMDLQQTYAEANRAAMERLPEGVRPRFWRRVLMGEENCALCVVASTQRYRIETLNPIHPGCDCAVDAIFGPAPEQVIDEDRLEQVHAAVAELTGQADRGGRAPDYRDLIVQMTPEHGELGPMLVRPRQHFTGPEDL